MHHVASIADPPVLRYSLSVDSEGSNRKHKSFSCTDLGQVMVQRNLRKPGKRLTQALAANLQNFRRKKGLSQEDLAEICGLHRTYVGSVERQERNVTLSTLEVFAKALGVSVPELLTPQGEND